MTSPDLNAADPAAPRLARLLEAVDQLSACLGLSEVAGALAQIASAYAEAALVHVFEDELPVLAAVHPSSAASLSRWLDPANPSGVTEELYEALLACADDNPDPAPPALLLRRLATPERTVAVVTWVQPTPQAAHDATLEEILRRAPRFLEAARTRTESARRIQLLERALSVLEHDLRGAAFGIGLMVQALFRRLSTRPELASLSSELELIERTDRRIRDLLARVLDTTRLGRGALLQSPQPRSP